MDDAVHVQIQVIKLHLVGVGFSRIDGYPDTIALFRLKETKGGENRDSSVSVGKRRSARVEQSLRGVRSVHYTNTG